MNAIETSIIELKDVEISFTSQTGSLFKPNKAHAVRDINLSVPRNQTSGLAGESGCGKSTTANVMCGLTAPTAGKVYFNGEEVMKRTAQIRRGIGRAVSVVFQDPATMLSPRMIMCDQFVDPMRIHEVRTEEERQKRVMKLISMMGLSSSALEALPGQLSGGQCQCVAIARALSLNPDAITADEPTSALNVSVRAQVLNLLTNLKRELNLTMVSVFHDIRTVCYISGRITVMNRGLVVEEGPVRQLLENPKDPYTCTLLDAIPSLLHPILGGK